MPDWQFTPYMLPLVASAAVSIGLIVYAWPRRAVAGAVPLCLLMAAVAEWSVVNVLEMGAGSLPTKLFWANLEYLGIVTVPVAWLAFALEYTGNGAWLTRGVQALLAVVPVLTVVLVWTNDRHGLMRQDVQLSAAGPFTIISKTYGPWFWVHTIYSYLLIALAMALLLQALARLPRLYRTQALALLFASLAPVAGNIMYVLRLGPVPWLDPSPGTFTLSGLAVAWGIYRLHLLDVVPVAQGAIVENMRDAVLVFDAQERIVHFNPAARRYLGQVLSHAIGQPAGRVFAEWPELTRVWQNSAEGQAEVALSLPGDSIYFDVRTVPIYDWHGRFAGRLVSLHDVTGRRRMQDALADSYRLLEERVAERTRELSALLEVSTQVTSTLEFKPLPDLILEQLKTLVDYQSAAIFVAQDDDLVLLDYRGRADREQALRVRLPTQKTGVHQEVLEGRSPLIVADLQSDTPPARSLRAAIAEQTKSAGGELNPGGYIRSWMGVPLVVGDEGIGLLTVTHIEPNYYTPRHARLVLALANQAAVAIENARLYEQAQRLAVFEERQRLARELHDSVSHELYGISLGAQTARTLLDRDPGQVAESLDFILSSAKKALAEMRALIFDLRPESLATDGLVAALAQQAASLQARFDFQVEAQLPEEPELPLRTKEALYNIAREALHNTARHARPRRVVLSLDHTAERTVLEVADDGIGFDAAGRFPGHLGLQSMRERAARLGGALDITSAPGHGTRVHVEIPR